ISLLRGPPLCSMLPPPPPRRLSCQLGAATQWSRVRTDACDLTRETRYSTRTLIPNRSETPSHLPERWPMKGTTITIALCAIGVLGARSAVSASSPGSSPSFKSERIPLQFEINQGQHAPDVRFSARGAGYGLYLTDSATVFV